VTGYEIDVPHLPDGMHSGDAYGRRIINDIAAGRNVVMRDTHADARVDAALRASFDAVGLRAAVSVPIRTKSGATVVLGFHSARPRAWTKSEIARIEETAMRRAKAVERGRSEEALRKSEESYRSLVEGMHEQFALCELVRDEDCRAVDTGS